MLTKESVIKTLETVMQQESIKQLNSNLSYISIVSLSLNDDLTKIRFLRFLKFL